jgi:predicted TIM-barrel fold metal-dependent hydrolase
MREAGIVDIYAQMYQTAEIGSQGLTPCPPLQSWERPLDDLRAGMREAGIWRSVIATITPTQTMRRQALALLSPGLSHQSRQKAEAELHEHLLQCLQQHNLWGCDLGRSCPEFLPFINIDPVLMDAVVVRQKVREAVSRGARGIVLLPALHGFYGNDRRAWPVYEVAQSFQLPILCQSGDAGPLPAGGRGHWGRPRYFGDVAAAFPKLKLILGHLGKGYESEIAVLIRRYANVYTETSTRLSGLDEAGRWTPAEAVTWFRLIGIDRILFGTKWPRFDPRQDVQTLCNLPLTREEKRKILSDNAKRTLQLES